MRLTITVLLLVAFSAMLANQLTDYIAWKAQIAARHACNTRSSVGNDYVEVHCDDTTGMFTIGTADGENLTFGYPSMGSTSHTNVKIDDVVYSNDEWIEGATPFPAGTTTVVDNTIITVTQVEDLVLTQYLEPVQSDSAGAIWIYYTVQNNSTEAHDVGLLLEIDTQIGANDGAPLATSYGLVSVETEFNTPNIPMFWQAFESSNYDPTMLIGEGVLAGGTVVAPDYFVAGGWGDLYDIMWDYTATGNDIWDSAVVYRWDQTTVLAGGTALVGTLYGTGEVSANQGDLALLLVAPDELADGGGMLSPNPFEVNLIVQNTTDGVASNVQATLALQEGLSFYQCEGTQSVSPSDIDPMAVGVCSWLVWAEVPASDVTYTLVVEVTSDNTAGNNISREIFVPHIVAVDDNESPAVAHMLEPNQPNPFNPSTRIAFNLPQPGVAEIVIYDSRGRQVRSFGDIAAPNGTGAVVWDGRDNHGGEMASGVYFYQLRVGGETLDTRRMVMLK